MDSISEGENTIRESSGPPKGRSLKAVPPVTRPTTDKVKEAIFSMIGPYFTGGQVLDLFAGTGGMGIEALSRGMDKAIFVDIDKQAIRVIRENLQRSDLIQMAEVYQNDAHRALNILGRRGIQFDLVILDPPYQMTMMGEVVERMQQLSLFNPGADIVIEHHASVDYADQIGEAVKRRCLKFGDTKVSFYEYDI